MDFENYLVHYGVLGMKWGIRKDRQGVNRGIRATSPTHGSLPASPEHVESRRVMSQKRTAGIHTLSNKELQSTINRLNLERSYSSLDPTATQQGYKYVKETLAVAGTLGTIYGLSKSPLGKALAKAIKRLAKKG